MRIGLEDWGVWLTASGWCFLTLTFQVLISHVINATNPNQPTHITSINTSTISNYTGPVISMTIPLELLREFDDRNGEVRIISALYKNISLIFSAAVQTNSSLGSDVVASSLQCGKRSCSTSNFTLTTSNVTITFEHSIKTKEILMAEDVETSCVFLDLLYNNGLTPTKIFNIGYWSPEGCTKNTSLSSTSKTVCECNHLTHFAILLSSKLSEFSNPVKLSLNIISYIGVAVSVVAMILTIIIVTLLTTSSKERPLLAVRNYIHINLCINLIIAQILFVSGVDKTGPSNGNISIHCQVVAVFLHYFFLVSFMWMLMEGVVLYLALVKVFVTQRNKYIIGFTLTSYCIPLIYLVTIPIPLGFFLNGGQYYGYDRACFLNPDTYFIWCFIAPVILIFLANIGFFIMAVRISWKHHMKKVNYKRTINVLSWFKSTIPLMVVLGLTWIIGLLIVEVKELAPLAYIFTMMVAFQGLFIFLCLVVLSKGVRDEIRKWWKSKINIKECSINLDTNRKFTGMELPKKAKNPKTNIKNSSNTKDSIVIENSERL